VRRGVDLHLYETRPDGALHYGSAIDGESFPAEALSGRGVISHTTVRCEAPDWAVQWRTGCLTASSGSGDAAGVRRGLLHAWSPRR
jgi:hypothetical protein